MKPPSPHAANETRTDLPDESQPLYTIGYGARTLDEFMAGLQEHRIEYVLDVRSAPYSKYKPEFSREALERTLKERGFRYLFMGDTLGGQPKDLDCYLEGKVDYEKVRSKEFFQAGLERLKKACQQKLRAALLCSEGRPEQCHRSKLIGEALEAAGIPVAHIDESGELRTQAEVIRRLTGGQMDLFGQQAFASRKRYSPGPGEAEECQS
jgi:uncharacterized protein (DUF488 family)